MAIFGHPVYSWNTRVVSSNPLTQKVPVLQGYPFSELYVWLSVPFEPWHAFRARICSHLMGSVHLRFNQQE